MTDNHILKVVQRSRLDRLLAQTWPDLQREQVQQMLRSDAVLVNGQPARQPGLYVAPGAEVEVTLAPLVPTTPEMLAPLPLAVLFEDDALLVVEKLAGARVWPSKWATSGVTLAQQLAERVPQMAHIGAVGRSGIVMQMEDEVSGLVLAAKTEAVYRELRRFSKRERLTRTYSALVEGRLRGAEVIDQPIGNARHDRGRLMVAREGRPAQTGYRAQRHYRDGAREYSLVEVCPETSRMHQIRVHLAWYGYPLVGDRLYGSRQQSLLSDRIFLHLGVLEFPHPVNATAVRVESPLPPELAAILRYLTRPKSA